LFVRSWLRKNRIEELLQPAAPDPNVVDRIGIIAIRGFWKTNGKPVHELLGSFEKPFRGDRNW